MIARRLIVLGLAGAGLFGCGRVPAHSDYFMVAFLPGTPAPSQEGMAGLGNATREARRQRPNFIAVTGAGPTEGATSTLTQQRLDAIAHAFVEEGVDTALIRTDIRTMGDKDYDERKDSFIIQLSYGVATKAE